MHIVGSAQRSFRFLLASADDVAYILIMVAVTVLQPRGIDQLFLKQKNSGDGKMANGVTLRSVEKLAQQLPPAMQLQLISRLSQRLSARSIETLSKTTKKTMQQIEEERRVRAEKLLAEMDAVAEKFPGKSNVVAEIRRMRKQRTRQIWKNVLTPM